MPCKVNSEEIVNNKVCPVFNRLINTEICGNCCEDFREDIQELIRLEEEVTHDQAILYSQIFMGIWNTETKKYQKLTDEEKWKAHHKDVMLNRARLQIINDIEEKLQKKY